jgi:hypothetical protein
VSVEGDVLYTLPHSSSHLLFQEIVQSGMGCRNKRPWTVVLLKNSSGLIVAAARGKTVGAPRMWESR